MGIAERKSGSKTLPKTSTGIHGRYELEEIDLFQKPFLAKGEQIIATPTLIKQLPLPLRRIIGDMTNKEKVILGLDLQRSD